MFVLGGESATNTAKGGFFNLLHLVDAISISKAINVPFVEISVLVITVVIPFP